MSNREKWMSVALLGQAAWDAVLYQRFLRRMTSILLLAVAAGVTATVAVVGLVYCLYRLLVRYGIEADMAALIVSVAVALVATMLVYMAMRQTRHLRKSLPIVSRLRDVAGAFVEGFMKSHQPKEKYYENDQSQRHHDP
jgi:FlaA1/EpsC-like NDP-sugar epimerase